MDQLFIELFEMETVKFRRCIKPKDAVGNPDLIMFSDGSDEAYGTCACVRWNLASGKFGSVLVAAKNRVNPVRKITTVRAELNGALLLKRLGSFIKESRNTHAAVRVGEIQEATALSDWYWVKGHMNIVDWTTRGGRRHKTYQNTTYGSKGQNSFNLMNLSGQ